MSTITAKESYTTIQLQDEPRQFYKDALGLTGLEISRTVLQPEETFPIIHKHQQNEEVYIVLAGQGEMQVDGNIFPFFQGSLVRIAPEGNRGIRNTGDTPLEYLCIQAKVGSLSQWTGTDGIITSQTPEWPAR